MPDTRFLLCRFTATGCALLLSATLAAQMERRESPSAGAADHGIQRVLRDPSRATARRVYGPVLGFVPDREAGLAPLLGIPGAATVGPVIGPLPALRSVATSAGGRYALGVAGEDGHAVLLRNLGATPSAVPLENLPSAIDRIVLSPTGSAAAVYSRGAGAITVIRGLPNSPEIAWSTPRMTLPGPVAALAVNDRGDSALAAVGEGGSMTVVLLQPGKDWRYLATAGAPVSLAFLVNRSDAVYADGAANQVFLVRNPGRTAELRLLAGEAQGVSHPVGVAATGDNRRVVIANSDPGGVLTVSLDGAKAVSLACRCSPSGLERLNGNAVFRVKETPGLPVHVFDGDSSMPRILVVPPRSGPGNNQGGDE